MFSNWFPGIARPRAESLLSSTRPATTAARRRYRPQIEALEDRLLPSTSPLKVPLPLAPIQSPIVRRPDQSAAPPVGAIIPSQMRHAYGLDLVTFAGVTGDGTGQTVAIIDPGDNPSFVSSTDPNFATSDLHLFDLQFGLPDPPSFMKLNQQGQNGNYPPPNVSNGAGEEALDVEWVHALAPGASIVLIEANSFADADIFNACLAVAKSIPNVCAVSMSFGGPENAAEEAAIDPLFTTPAGHQGITFLASTGDFGAPGGYPAYSPNVVAVGGTTLSIDSSGNYLGETGWSLGSDSFNPALAGGGGVSEFEPQPAYQHGVVTQSSTNRTIPDVAFDADPATGVAVFDSFDNGAATPWATVGGTSLSCPLLGGHNGHHGPGPGPDRPGDSRRRDGNAAQNLSVAVVRLPRHHDRLQRLLGGTRLRSGDRARDSHRSASDPRPGRRVQLPFFVGDGAEVSPLPLRRRRDAAA